MTLPIDALRDCNKIWTKHTREPQLNLTMPTEDLRLLRKETLRNLQPQTRKSSVSSANSTSFVNVLRLTQRKLLLDASSACRRPWTSSVRAPQLMQMLLTANSWQLSEINNVTLQSLHPPTRKLNGWNVSLMICTLVRHSTRWKHPIDGPSGYNELWMICKLKLRWMQKNRTSCRLESRNSSKSSKRPSPSTRLPIQRSRLCRRSLLISRLSDPHLTSYNPLLRSLKRTQPPKSSALNKKSVDFERSSQTPNVSRASHPPTTSSTV